MTIDEAIELNRQAVESLKKGKFPDHAKAVELGNEALRFRLHWEQQEGEDDFPLLPGETKE